MVKAIIFDCFGVVITDTLEHAYTTLGGDFKQDLPKIIEVLHAADKGQITNHHEILAEMLGVSESAYTNAISSGRKVNEELLAYIEKELKPNYRVAMLSNVSKGRLPEIFGEGFLEQYFDPVIASGDIGFAKPEARAFEIAADSVGVRLDECVFTDDRPEYLEGARAVGMKTILFDTTEQFIHDLEKLLKRT